MDPGTSSRHQRLTSGQDTWSARCAERCTPGAGGDLRKRPGGNTGTAPQVYLTTAMSGHRGALVLLIASGEDGERHE